VLVYCLPVTADTSALEPGTVVAGRYRIEGKLAHGGMGAVYHVHHVHTDESLALKILHPQILRDASAVERFRREARAPARITSEHVARVTDADTASELDGAPFYVMELLRGRDLERIVLDDGPLPPVLVVEYLRQMARALDKAHSLSIVHRDLKPENLFLTHREDGSPCIKLIDFGIARLGDPPGVAPGANANAAMPTQTGYVFGTPNYMAPEQATGEVEKVSAATDIWAVGLVAFKLLFGKEYFTARSAPHLYAQILTEPLVPPSVRGSTFGPKFDDWFARCVVRDIPSRMASAGEAVRALAAALDVPIAERQQSSPDFSLAPRPSDPAIAAPPASVALPLAGGTLSGGGNAGVAAAVLLPTALPDAPLELPRPPSRRPLVPIAIAAGLVVAIIGGVFLVRALARPATTDASYGLIASGTAADSAAPPSAPTASTTGTTTTTATAMHASDTPAPKAASGSDTRPRPAAKPSPSTAPKDDETPGSGSRGSAAGGTRDHATLSREQRKRLESLDRLCSQGTYTAAECQSKRQAIMHGGS
jgi:eukaryotic-like serine/threonine-protein kinase